MVWIGLIWLRIGNSRGLLWTRQWTFGFHKMLGSSWVAAQLAASQEGLSSVSGWHQSLYFYNLWQVILFYDMQSKVQNKVLLPRKTGEVHFITSLNTRSVALL
jgi:hypothetical protein